MEDWGTPSGLDPSAYGATSDWNEDRWRWEFIRRRSDYRSAFDFLAPLSHAAWEQRAKQLAEENAKGIDHLPPGLRAWRQPPPPINSREFCAWPVWGEEALFDYPGLPNPRFSDVPAYLIAPIHAGHDFYQRTIEPEELVQTKNPYTLIPAGHVAVRFNLQIPIAQQLDGLRGYLEEQAKELGISHSRSHGEKRFTYLRVLDARSRRASWSEISEILPASIGNRTPQAARDVHRQATRLQDALWINPRK